jgi:hypothetical protein
MLSRCSRRYKRDGKTQRYAEKKREKEERIGLGCTQRKKRRKGEKRIIIFFSLSFLCVAFFPGGGGPFWSGV